MRVRDFILEDQLGTGGMGIVYQARRALNQRPVALKILGSNLRTQAQLDRFEREAEILRKLVHPNIIRFVDFFVVEGQSYLVTELAPGVDLQRLLDRLRALEEPVPDIEGWLRQALQRTTADLALDEPPREDLLAGYAQPLKPSQAAVIGSRTYIDFCTRIFGRLVAAMSYAHEQNALHLDLKPGNVVVGPTSETKIIDFGVARHREASLSVSVIAGTPEYMSPEQLSGAELDARCDIYALGVLFYELLTLENPYYRQGVSPAFAADGAGSLSRSGPGIRAAPPLRWLNGRVSSQLERVIHKAMSRRPDQRYQSTLEFQRDLELAIAGRSVKARRYAYRPNRDEIVVERPNKLVAVAAIYGMFGILDLVTIVGVSLDLLYGQTVNGLIGSEGAVIAHVQFSIMFIVFMLAAMVIYKGYAAWMMLSAAVNLLLIWAFVNFLNHRVTNPGPIFVVICVSFMLLNLASASMLIWPHSLRWAWKAGRVRRDHRRERKLYRGHFQRVFAVEKQGPNAASCA